MPFTSGTKLVTGKVGWMDEASPDRTRDGHLLSETVKGVRKHRAMTTRDTASAMNISLRTYQRFEAGTTRFNLDHIHRFAVATRSDPYAIILAMAIGSPAFAVHSADNKIGTIITIGAQKFDQTLGARISELDTHALVDAVAGMFDRLTDRVLQPDPAKAWLDAGEAALSARRPKPGR